MKDLFKMFKFAADDGGGSAPANIDIAPPVPGITLNGSVASPPVAVAASSPAAQPQLTFAQVLNEKGEFAENWQNVLPEELRAKPWLKNFKSIDGLVQSYDAAQGLIGKKGIVPPSASSTPEEKEQFYRSLGKPEKPEAYKLDAPALPEGMYKDEMGKNFQQIAHQANLSEEQAKAVWSQYWNLNKSQIEAQQNAQAQRDNESVMQLKREWGNAFSQQLDLANRVVKTFGLAEMLADKGLSNDPTMAKALAAIGATMSEDRIINGNATMVPASAKSEADKIMRSEAFMKPDHIEHDIAVRKYNELMKQAYPG